LDFLVKHYHQQLQGLEQEQLAELLEPQLLLEAVHLLRQDQNLLLQVVVAELVVGVKGRHLPYFYVIIPIHLDRKRVISF
jgi:hypothetical protein